MAVLWRTCCLPPTAYSPVFGLASEPNRETLWFGARGAGRIGRLALPEPDAYAAFLPLLAKDP
jgi:hypothetical protein